MKVFIVYAKNIILFNVFFFLAGLFAFGQENNPPADSYGENFRKWVKTEWYNDYQNISFNASKGYRKARLAMYNDIDNFNDTMYCFYGNLAHLVPEEGYTTPGHALPFNCEHIVPQSFFDKRAPMVCDIHHLVPTFDRWNSTRGSFPFDENEDERTEKWMYLDKSIDCDNNIPCIPPDMVDAYSELISNQNESTFEPKENSKGNVARSIFYFFTVYPNYDINRVGSIQTFYDWHVQDPVNDGDEARNDAIAEYQGNHNPYINHPDWVYRAWIADTVVAVGLPTPIKTLVTNLTYTLQGNLILKIENPQSKWLNISIHNIYGEIIQQFSTTQQQYFKDIGIFREQYNKGLYLMRIATEEESIDTYMFYLL